MEYLNVLQSNMDTAEKLGSIGEESFEVDDEQRVVGPKSSALEQELLLRMLNSQEKKLNDRLLGESALSRQMDKMPLVSEAAAPAPWDSVDEFHRNTRPMTYNSITTPMSPRATDILLDLPPEISSDAAVRLLKVKVRTLQDESVKMTEDHRRLLMENSALTNTVKNIEETTTRLQRAATSHQQNADRLKQQLETSATHTAQIETESAVLRKEVETLKKSQKLSSTSQNLSEVRLNRALEQVEKFKQQVQRSQQVKKDICSQDQKKMDELLLENRRLQKQKNDLLMAYKKQMKLIDIFKRQKMHIEASQVLQFTEDEFLKAIEWKE